MRVGVVMLWEMRKRLVVVSIEMGMARRVQEE